MESRIYHIIRKKAQGETLSKQDEQVLAAFLTMPENKDLYTSLLDVWQATTVETPDFQFDVNSEWQDFQTRIQKDKKGKTRKLITFVSSMAAAMVIGLSIFWGLQNKVQDQNYLAGNTIEQIILPDETVVKLNKQSSLRVDGHFNETDRQVYLQGEAFFDVASNKEKPFRIRLENQLEVEVVGTSFNIRSFSRENNTGIEVVSGLVKVKDGKEQIELSKGQRAIYNKTEKTLHKEAVRNPYLTIWHTGEFKFDNTPLKDLIEPFERYFNRKIIFPKNYQTLSYSGQFKEPSVEEFAQTISTSFGWNYSITDTRITFTR